MSSPRSQKLMSNSSLKKGSPSAEETLKSLPPGRRYKKENLEKEMENEDEGKGSPTRGWAASAPQKGRERHELKNKCGDACFLDPKKEGYPVCPSLESSGGKCEIDPRGVESAKQRARQYGHEDIADKAQKLQYKYGFETKRLGSPRRNAERGARSTSPKRNIQRGRNLGSPRRNISRTASPKRNTQGGRKTSMSPRRKSSLVKRASMSPRRKVLNSKKNTQRGRGIYGSPRGRASMSPRSRTQSSGKMTKLQLQNLLRSRKMKVSGNKSELIQRLNE